MAKSILQRRIRQLREGFHPRLTQGELAKRLGLKDKSAVAHWEAGDTSPRADLLPRIARVLKVTVADLYREAA